MVLPIACCIATLTTMSASAALAHQTDSNRGVSVTVHVTPDDEPVSGQPSRVIVSKVRPGSGRFAWKSCKCYLRISDSAGNVVLNRRAKRTTRFTFPRATAYEIVFSGRVKRSGGYKRFRVSFAIRAS
jgi:hypothetical protein